MVACYSRVNGLGNDIWAPVMALGLRPRAMMAALRPVPRPFNYKQSLTYNYGHAGLDYMTDKQSP